MRKKCSTSSKRIVQTDREHSRDKGRGKAMKNKRKERPQSGHSSAKGATSVEVKRVECVTTKAKSAKRQDHISKKRRGRAKQH